MPEVDEEIDEAGEAEEEDGVLEWQATMVLHAAAMSLPAHPLNRKIRLRVHVQALGAKLGMSQAQLDHLVLVAGPRYKSESDVLLLTCDIHPKRADNQRHLLRILNELVKEAKTAIPS